MQEMKKMIFSSFFRKMQTCGLTAEKVMKLHLKTCKYHDVIRENASKPRTVVHLGGLERIKNFYCCR